MIPNKAKQILDFWFKETPAEKRFQKNEVFDQIIKAAGGIVSTWTNKDAVNAGNILVSSNQSIHNKFLKLLKPISK